jgi:hypothetical protein
MDMMARILISCDEFIAGSPSLRGNAAKDKACAAYLSGVIAALRFAPHTFHGVSADEIAARLYYINLGGYGRIRSMAQSARDGAQREAKGG